jgi:hypothetical protein
MYRKLKNQVKLWGFVLASIGTVFVLLSQSSASAIARGYQTSDSGLQTGMVVALSVDGSSGSSVERASQDSSNRVVGIVTTLNNSLVTVSSSTAKVLVESEGQTDAYVSDINGKVNQGDLLILSPLKGILMKSGDAPATVIGIAADDASATVPYSYQEEGQAKETQIAKIKINLNHQGGGNAGVLPSDSALARLGRSLVGKDVGEARVLIALILFIIVLIAEGGIIYGAVSSAITALGRNPLAGKIIRNELLRVVAIALIVLLVGLAAVYAVLWI